MAAKDDKGKKYSVPPYLLPLVVPDYKLYHTHLFFVLVHTRGWQRQKSRTEWSEITQKSEKSQ